MLTPAVIHVTDFGYFHGAKRPPGDYSATHLQQRCTKKLEYARLYICAEVAARCASNLAANCEAVREHGYEIMEVEGLDYWVQESKIFSGELTAELDAYEAAERVRIQKEAKRRILKHALAELMHGKKPDKKDSVGRDRRTGGHGDNAGGKKLRGKGWALNTSKLLGRR